MVPLCCLYDISFIYTNHLYKKDTNDKNAYNLLTAYSLEETMNTFGLQSPVNWDTIWFNTLQWSGKFYFHIFCTLWLNEALASMFSINKKSGFLVSWYHYVTAVLLSEKQICKCGQSTDHLLNCGWQKSTTRYNRYVNTLASLQEQWNIQWWIYYTYISFVPK